MTTSGSDGQADDVRDAVHDAADRPGRTQADREDELLLARYADPSVPRGQREAAFTALVDRFQRRVFAVCLRTLGGDVADAEDATQEVFVRLARSAATFRGDAKLSTWLYTVARNVATDRIRAEARRPSTPVADVAEAASLGRHAALADDHHAEVETAGDLAAALAQLDETSRTLLLLVAVEGLSYAEAAAAADLAVGTVKSRVSRARARLGELLATSDVDARSTSGRAADHGAPQPPGTAGSHPGRDPPGDDTAR